MSRIVVPADSWVEIYDSSTSGSFRTYGFTGRIKRGTSTPSDKGGMPIKGGKGVYSELITIASDGTNNLYIYNPTTETGYVSKDI